MPENPTPAFRERPPLASSGNGGAPARGAPPRAFWGAVLLYAALHGASIHPSLLIAVPPILLLLVILAVKAERSREKPLAARYLAAWPWAWQGVWIFLAGTCLFWAIAAPLLLLMLSVVFPVARSGDALALVMLKAAGLFLVPAALCAWFAFRGHRAAFVVADAGARAAAAGTDAVRRQVARIPRMPRWRRARGSDVARVSPLLGQPWDGLVVAVGWVTCALVAGIPMRRATETSRAVFFVGAGICIAMTLLYAGVGRVYLRTRERRLVRRVFQPFLLGTALTLGIAALGIGISLAYGPL